MISEFVKNFIEKYNLKEPFIVAFSGGYDSMCLLDVLFKLKFNVIAVHLNHNWRGKESNQEELNSKKFAEQRGIPFYSEILSNEVPHTETAARDARYDFFKRCAEKYNSEVVFTAHNYDDNAETILYRIIKGTGIAGLQGICEKREIFYRPLLSVSRKDIEVYCSENNLTPNKDSSNENTKYKRNLIRKEIFPLMRKINPSITKSLNSLSELAGYDCKLIEKFAKDDINYKIRELLIENNLDYDRKKIEEIKEFVEENKNSKSGKKMSLSNDKWLYVNNCGYEVIETTTDSQTNLQIMSEGEYSFDNYIFSIKKCLKKPDKYPKDAECEAYINVDKIDFELRYRKDGDIIKPLGNTGTQKLKKYLNEKKIPSHKKNSIPLLCSKNDVLWVAGYGISDKIKVKDVPTHVIKLEKNNG